MNWLAEARARRMEEPVVYQCERCGSVIPTEQHQYDCPNREPDSAILDEEAVR